MCQPFKLTLSPELLTVPRNGSDCPAFDRYARGTQRRE